MVAGTAEKSHLEPQQETERKSLLKACTQSRTSFSKATLPNPFQTATSWGPGIKTYRDISFHSPQRVTQARIT